MYGVKTEVKNLNSFRFVGQAIEHEIRRQAAILDAGVEVQQQTRRFDTKRGVTLFMRGKEDAHDYRYFPEPDLLPLVLEAGWLEEIASDLPELADARARPLRRRRPRRRRRNLPCRIPSPEPREGISMSPGWAYVLSE